MLSRQRPGVSRSCRKGKVRQLVRVTYRHAVIGLVEILPETVKCSFSADSFCCYQIFLKQNGTGQLFPQVFHTHTHTHTHTHSPLQEPQRNVPKSTARYQNTLCHPYTPFTLSDASRLTLMCFSHRELTYSRNFKLTSL